MENYRMIFYKNGEFAESRVFSGANRFCAEYNADEYCRAKKYDSFTNIGKE